MINRKLNIIITASPIKSHPSTVHIDKTIDSLELLTYPDDTKIILSHDYPSDGSMMGDYMEYYRILKDKYKDRNNMVFTMSETHGHLTGNVKNAFNYVDSKYVLLVQHDFPFVRNVNLNDVMSDMDNNYELKHVRFNKRKNICTAGDWLTQDCDTKIFNNFNINGINEYVSTFCWSDNNHLSPTEYYTEIVLKECRIGTPMENNLYFKLQKIAHKGDKNEILNSHQKYGTFLYDKLNSDEVIYHTDGRGN